MCNDYLGFSFSSKCGSDIQKRFKTERIHLGHFYTGRTGITVKGQCDQKKIAKSL